MSDTAPVQGFVFTVEASAEVIPGDPPETEENDR